MKEEKLVFDGWAARANWLNGIWVRYGLTDKGYQVLWDGQAGECAGCKGRLAHPLLKSHQEGLKPEVESTGEEGGKKARGLLCGKCKGLLETLRNNRKVLNNLNQYLTEKGERDV